MRHQRYGSVITSYSIHYTKLYEPDLAYPLAPVRGNSLNDPFTLAEVEAGISYLHNGRSVGFSGYPSELLRVITSYSIHYTKLYDTVIKHALLLKE